MANTAPHTAALATLLNQGDDALHEFCFHVDGGRPANALYSAGRLKEIGEAIRREAMHIERVLGVSVLAQGPTP